MHFILKTKDKERKEALYIASFLLSLSIVLRMKSTILISLVLSASVTKVLGEKNKNKNKKALNNFFYYYFNIRAYK
jgi:hypothetical protein